MNERMINFYMTLTQTCAEMSRATRLKVGCVIAKNNNIISFSWNGTPAGWDNTCEHTEYVGSDEQIPSPDEMKRLGFTGTDSGWYRLVTKDEVIHAEANAILKLARDGERGNGASLFCTHAPCIHCAKLIYGAGIGKVYYRNTYRDTRGIEFLEKCGIEVEQV